MFFLRKKPKAKIIPRSEHTLSRRDIDPEAIKVLYRLSSLDYEAYLVGGSVRDLLLGRKPKDFDIGTNARPNEIKHIFTSLLDIAVFSFMKDLFISLDHFYY